MHKTLHLLLCVTAFLSFSGRSFAYEIAESFQYPLDSYNVECNELGTINKCVRNDKYHLGDDASATAGTDVYAVANGEIEHAKYHPPKYDKDGKLVEKNYGGVIIIEHTLPSDERVCSLYAHLDFDTFTKLTGPVLKGERLGKVGTYAKNGLWGPHLHFGIRKGVFVDGLEADKKWKYGGYSPSKDVVNNWYEPLGFIKGHMSSPPQSSNTLPYPELSVVKFSNSPKVYLYYNKQLWHIRDEEAYSKLGFNTGNCVTPDFSKLTILPESDWRKYCHLVNGVSFPFSGNVVKIIDSIGPRTCKVRDKWRDPSSVYFLDAGKFRPIVNEKAYFEIVSSKGWDNIVLITQDVFDMFGEGFPVNSGADLSGYYGGDGFIDYVFGRSTTCKGVQTNSPYDPVTETSQFVSADNRVYSWLELDDIYVGANVKWKWYNPQGNLVFDYSDQTVDPRSNGYPYYSWYKTASWLDISTTNNYGQWQVVIAIDGVDLSRSIYSVGPGPALPSTPSPPPPPTPQPSLMAPTNLRIVGHSP